MVALGLILILLAVVMTVALLIDSSGNLTVTVFGLTVRHVSVAGLFLTGVATMTVFFLGLWMVLKAMSRSRRKRQERKAMTKEQRKSVDAVEEERARLKAENDRLSEQLSRESRPVVTGSEVSSEGTHDVNSDDVSSVTNDGRPADPTDLDTNDTNDTTTSRHGH